MTSERKKLYLYAGINFIIGITLGIVLFYGQIRHNPSVFSTEYSYDKTVEIIDFLRAWWLNAMWLFSVFIAHGLLRAAPIHIIVGVRGCASSYGSMYIANYLGIKETVISVLPQCMTILPLLMWYSVTRAEKRREDYENGREGIVMRRTDGIKIFLLSLISAVLETAIFALFSYCLF